MLAKISRLNHLRMGLLQGLLTLGALLLSLAVASPAQAAGRVVWKKTTVVENVKREAWRLELEIHLSKAPDVAYVPMKLEFQPTAHYERSLVDGHEEPQLRTIPLSNQQSIIESVDVGFLDAGTGVIQSRTRFSFKVTRAHDFNAGEYKVTLKDTRNGATVGVPTTLKFEGENPVVDRRSIVFAGGEKKKKKEEPQQAAAESEDEGADGSEDESSAPPEAEEGNAPPAVEERPGGGCHHSPTDTAPLGWLFVSLLGAVALVLRRHAARR